MRGDRSASGHLGMGSILEPDRDDVEAGLPDNDDVSVASMKSTSTVRSTVIHRATMGHRRLDDQDMLASLTEPLLEEGRGPPGASLPTAGGDLVPELDVQETIYRNLPSAIEHITSRGVRQLGSFSVPVREVWDLVANDDMLTLGSDGLHEEDWATMWQQRLRTLRLTHKGEKAVVEVTAHVVTIRNAGGTDDDGILNPLLHCYQDGACGMHVFGLPAVQAVVAFKWQTWARQYLYWELACYLVWLGSFQVFTLIFVDEDFNATLAQLLATHRGRATVISEIVTLIGMLPFLYVEMMTLVEYGPWGWLNLWNALDVIAYANQVLIAFCHLTRYGVASDKLSIMVCIQVLLLWFKVQYFARVLQPMSNPFVETIANVVNAIKWYLVLLGLLLWGYTCAFYLLFRKDQVDAFTNIPHALLTVFWLVLGSFDQTLVFKSRNPTAAAVLAILGTFTMSMVLLNCLIALMADAANKVRDDGGQLFTHSRAQIIDELETCIPRWLRARKTAWYPTYIHFLKVNHEKIDAAMFPNYEKDASEAANKQLMEKVESLEGEVVATRAEVKRLSALLEAVLEQVGRGEALPGPSASGRGGGRKGWLK